MRRSYKTLLVLFLLTGFSFAQVDPVALWKMNEGEGNSTTEPYNGLVAQIDGPNWTEGHIEYALVSNGYGDRIVVADNDLLDLTTEGSIGLWVKIHDYLPYAGLIHKGEKKNWRDEAYSLQFDPSGKKVRGYLSGEDSDIILDSESALDLDTWYYIMFTWNTNTLKIYINGVLDAEYNGDHAIPKVTNGSMQIASQLTQKYNNDFLFFGFDGTVDEVGIANEYLDSDDVMSIYESYLPDVEEDGTVIAYWKFDEGSGNTTIDSVNNLHGTLENVNWTNSGLDASGIEVTENDTRVVVENSDILNPDDEISIEVWLKWNIKPAEGNSYANLISKNGDKQYQIQHNADNDKFEFAVETEDGRRWLRSITSPEQGVWYYVVGTYSSSNEEMSIYVNGVKENTRNQSGEIVSTDEPIYIGDHEYPGRTFNGIIDNVRLCNYKLTDEEIILRYNMLKTEDGEDEEQFVLEFKLDEGRGNTTENEFGGVQGILNNSMEWTDGKSGSALLFNGTDQYVNFPETNKLELTGAIGLAAWVKAEENKTAKIWQKGDWDGHSLGQDIWDGWYGTISIAEEAYTLDWGSGRPVLGEWYHLFITYDGSIIKFYVNGELVNSKEVSGTLRQNNHQLCLGSDSGGQKFFNGTIDEAILLAFAPTLEEYNGYLNGFHTEEVVWEELEVTGFTSFPYSFDINSNGTIFSGNWGGAGIFRSSDEGITWENVQSGYWVWTVAIDDNDNIYVGTSSHGVIKSTDNGDSWIDLSVGAASNDFRDIVIRDNAIYASSWGGGVLKSTDDGATWENISSTLPSNVIHSISFDSESSLYAGAYDGLGVYKTTDDGTTWTNIEVPYGYIWSIDIAPNDDIFIGTYGGPNDDGVGLYISGDEGESWNKISEFDGLNIYGVNFVDDQVFIMTWENGMYVNGSGNENVESVNDWISFNSGLQSGEVSASIVLPDGTILLGTGDSRLYKNFDDITDVKESKNSIEPEGYAMVQNYPNPFNPSTIINFSLPVEAHVTITMYNTLGQKVKDIVSSNFVAGTQTFNFNASELASGIYIYQISAQGVDGSSFIDAKKMILMK